MTESGRVAMLKVEVGQAEVKVEEVEVETKVKEEKE